VPYFETVWTVLAAGWPVPAEREAMLRPLTRHLRTRGAAISGAEYATALGMLNVFSRRALAATADLDAVLVPTLAQLPQPVGYFIGDDGDPAADFERQKRFTPFTAMYNLTGQPAISLPLYQSAEGLPIGIMLVGRPRGEAPLLSLAAQLEAALPWTDRHPPVWLG
jgi:amidase